MSPRVSVSNGSSDTQKAVLGEGETSIPEKHVIPGGVQVFQTFNNCGPSSMSMALSLYGISKSQQEIGDKIRPYQVVDGNNDDKSVTLEELANYAEELGFVAYHRPYGDMETLKKYLANDIPIIARTLSKKNEDIGHYRVIKGYDDNRGAFIQDDSLQGDNIWYSYGDFRQLWRPYGYEYMIFVKPEKQALVEEILGENVDEVVAWENAVTYLEQDTQLNPDDYNLKLALSVAYYEVGEYEKSIETFESIESQLPFRALWYQIEPLLSYQELKRYDEVLPRIEAVLSNHNEAFSELYQMRGEIYLDQGKVDEARKEFELAVKYNKNYKPAQEALQSI